MQFFQTGSLWEINEHLKKQNLLAKKRHSATSQSWRLFRTTKSGGGAFLRKILPQFKKTSVGWTNNNHLPGGGITAGQFSTHFTHIKIQLFDCHVRNMCVFEQVQTWIWNRQWLIDVASDRLTAPTRRMAPSNVASRDVTNRPHLPTPWPISPQRSLCIKSELIEKWPYCFTKQCALHHESQSTFVCSLINEIWTLRHVSQALSYRECLPQLSTKMLK